MADDQIFKMGEDKLKLEYIQIKMETMVRVGLTNTKIHSEWFFSNQLDDN